MEELKLERAGDESMQGTEVMARTLGFKLLVFIFQDRARVVVEHGLRRGPERKWRDQSGSCVVIHTGGDGALV